MYITYFVELRKLYKKVTAASCTGWFIAELLPSIHEVCNPFRVQVYTTVNLHTFQIAGENIFHRKFILRFFQLAEVYNQHNRRLAVCYLDGMKGHWISFFFFDVKVHRNSFQIAYKIFGKKLRNSSIFNPFK